MGLDLYLNLPITECPGSGTSLSCSSSSPSLSLSLIITDLGEGGKAPRGRHIRSMIYYKYAASAGPGCYKYAAPTGLGGGLQTCCYKYAALTGLGRPSPKSVIIKFKFTFTDRVTSPKSVIIRYIKFIQLHRTGGTFRMFRDFPIC